MEIKPYADSEKSKREQVEDMFDNIAPSYDFLNHYFTVGIDRIWRRKAIKIAGENNPDSILDIAAGTGDFTILAAKKTNANKITGIDISQKMLDIAAQKVNKAKLDSRITLTKADSLNMPFSNDTFDAATVGFGVRNFADISAGISEIYRVLKKGGRLVVLELSEPSTPVVKGLFGFYFHKIMPAAGRLVSKDSSAYSYLPKSVEHFPYGKPFLEIMQKCGFPDPKLKWLCGGIAAIYWADKQ